MATPTRTALAGASWIDLVLGALVFLTPFFTVTSTVAFWNAIAVGALVAVLAVVDLYLESQGKMSQVRGPAVINVLAGLWLIGSAFVVAASMTYLWITGLAGLALVVSAGYEVAAANRMAAKPQPY